MLTGERASTSENDSDGPEVDSEGDRQLYDALFASLRSTSKAGAADGGSKAGFAMEE